MVLGKKFTPAHGIRHSCPTVILRATGYGHGLRATGTRGEMATPLKKRGSQEVGATVAPDTRLVFDYLLPRTGDNVTQITEWKQLATAVSRKAQKKHPFMQKGVACQEMNGDMMSKIFLDLDDSNCPTLEAAKAQTNKMIDWATAAVAKALEIDEEEAGKSFAFSTAIGEYWKNDAERGAPPDWQFQGTYKASAHLVVNSHKMKWRDQGFWVLDKGLVDAAPKQTNGDSVVDTNIYNEGARLIRLLANSKPGEPQSKGDPRIKVARTHTNAKQTFYHCLTTNLEKCEEVTDADAVEDEQSEEAEEQSEETGEQSEEGGEHSEVGDEPPKTVTKADWFVMETESLFTPEDVILLLNYCDPDIERKSWIGIASFLKNRCKGKGFENFNAFDVFADWCKTAKNNDPYKKIGSRGQIKQEWDALGNKMDANSFGTLCFHARCRQHVVVDEWARKQAGYIERYFKHANPGALAPDDFADLLELILPPTMTDGKKKDGHRIFYECCPDTGIWRQATQQLIFNAIKDLRQKAMKTQQYWTVYLGNVESTIRKKNPGVDDDEKLLKLFKKSPAWSKASHMLHGRDGWPPVVLSLGGSAKNAIIKAYVENKTEMGLEDLWNQHLVVAQLVPFTNGVYDLEKEEFRKAKNEEFILFTTGYDWKEPDDCFLDSDDQVRTYASLEANIELFMRSVCRDTQYDYKTLLWSACLLGYNRWEEFIIMTGKGANGKSTEVNFIKNIFGKLAGTLDPNFYMHRDGDVNKPMPALASLRHKRLCFSLEPPVAVIYGEKIKSMTGKDDVVSRELYKGVEVWKPGFNPVLIANSVPTLDVQEPAVARRLVWVGYPFCFKKEDAGTESMGEYQDPALCGYVLDDIVKSDEWQIAGMHYLLKQFSRHKEYILIKTGNMFEDITKVDSGVQLNQGDTSKRLPFFPKEWDKSLKDYMKASDTIQEWIDENLAFTHHEQFKNRPGIVAAVGDMTGQTPADKKFKKQQMPQNGMDDEIRRSKMMSDSTWGYQAWCKKVGKKQMGDAAAIIQQRLQKQGAGFSRDEDGGYFFSGVKWSNKRQTEAEKAMAVDHTPQDYAIVESEDEGDDDQPAVDPAEEKKIAQKNRQRREELLMKQQQSATAPEDITLMEPSPEPSPEEWHLYLRANPDELKPSEDCVFSYKVSEDFKIMTIGGVKDFQIAHMRSADGLHYVVKNGLAPWFEWKRSEAMSGNVIIDKPETFSGNSIIDKTTFAYKNEFESKQCRLIMDSGVWRELTDLRAKEDKEEEEDKQVVIEHKWPNDAPDDQVFKFWCERELYYATEKGDDTKVMVPVYEMNSDTKAGMYYTRGSRKGVLRWEGKDRKGFKWDAEQGKAVRKQPGSK